MPADITDVEFQFSNIGPIENAKLRLGDLTVIAGRNNTGKTYLAYSLYGFLKHSFNSLWRLPSDSSSVSIAYRRFRQLIQETMGPLLKINYDDATISEGDGNRWAHTYISEALSNEWRDLFLSRLAEIFTTQEFASVFGSRKSVEGSSFGATFDKSLVDVHRMIPGDSTSSEVGRQISYDGKGFTIRRDVKFVYQYSFPDNLVKIVVSQVLTDDIAQFLLPELFIEPFVISAERFGISLFYRELDLNRSSVIKELQTLSDTGELGPTTAGDLLDKATSRYALPIHDNINFTRSIPDIVSDTAALGGRSFIQNLRDMMDGRFVSERTGTLFVGSGPTGRFSIPIHLASSSVRGLSDLHFFVRHVARSNHLLIIDEPESHLDTRNQLLMTRLLARIVKVGLRVLITTHSDYIIKELNNLIMLQSVPQALGFAQQHGYDSDDGISPDAVRAYVASGGRLIGQSVDELGMSMPVFDDTIDQVNAVSNVLSDYVLQRHPELG